MHCFTCIVEWQRQELASHLDVRSAVTIYDGKALCMLHLNTERGLPAAPGFRYPKEEGENETN